MKKTKILLLTLLLIVGFGFSECDSCNCGDIDGTFYNILGLKKIEHSMFSNGVSTIVEADEIVDFEDYRGLNFVFNSEFTFSEINKKQPFLNFSLINTAYGCDCNYNGSDGSLQEVEAFDIITLNDFDSTHLANDTINEYFTNDFYNMTLDSFLNSSFRKKLYSTGLNKDIQDELVFHLSLNQSPSLDSTFQAKVNIEFDNGAIYTMETDAIIIR